MKKFFDPTLYLVTDNSLNKNLNILEIVEQAVNGGVTMVQLRAKEMSPEKIKSLGAELLKILKPNKIPLIINDHIEIAKEISADGVHLGVHDLSVKRARETLGPDFIIGLSIEDLSTFNPEQLKDVDYIAASPVFPTTTKHDIAQPLLIEGLKKLRQLSHLPLVAIGGINAENIQSVMETGADGVAIVSAICNSKSPKDAAIELKALIEKYKKPKTQFNALTIAGSDCSGGAGIQADLKTFQMLGCYGMSVITALTAQNTQTVKSIFPVSPNFVEDQIHAILEDIHVDSVKIGMLFSKEMIEVVARALTKFKLKNIVLDPVMIAKSGDSLLKQDSIDALKEWILPLANIVTPNIPEAEILSSMSIQSEQKRIQAARVIKKFSQSVLIKGGHSSEKDIVTDLFLSENNEIKRLSYPRIQTQNTHGTGCTYSAAIAAYLARGLPAYESIKTARIYLQGAIQSGENSRIGKGCGPVDHAWTFAAAGPWSERQSNLRRN